MRGIDPCNQGEVSVDPVPVAIFGLGAVGREVARALMTKRGLRIVCAVDAGEAAGQDLGAVLGLRALGLEVASDATAVAASGARVVVHSTGTKVADLYHQMKDALQAGCCIVTAAEEMVSPYTYDPEHAGLIDQLARRHGASVLGTGLWPTWMDVDLPLLLSAGSRDVESLRYVRKSDVRPYMDSVVASHFGVGCTPAEFEAGRRSGMIVGHVGFEGSYERLGHAFGWRIDAIEKSIEPVYAPDGRASAVITSAIGRENGRTRIEMVLHANTIADWVTSDTIELRGTPDIRMTMQPSLAGTAPVANVMVNHIPVALNAAPGIVQRSSVGAFCFADIAACLHPARG